MLAEHLFIKQGIEHGVRCDGRHPLESRLLSITTSTLLQAAGSSSLSVELSSPHIIVGTKAEISQIEKGAFKVTIDVMEKSSKSLRGKTEHMEKMIEILMLKYIDTQQLTIVEGKKYWNVYIDVVVLDKLASNALEHISFAILVSLRTLKIPNMQVYINKNTGEDHLEILNNYRGIILDSVPIIISVAKVGYI
jgi:exosome complex RNA-binding protein Rrp42 (RNase PH superfamily)